MGDSTAVNQAHVVTTGKKFLQCAMHSNGSLYLEDETEEVTEVEDEDKEDETSVKEARVAEEEGDSVVDDEVCMNEVKDVAVEEDGDIDVADKSANVVELFDHIDAVKLISGAIR
ncbi:hypothetical protein EJ08DRAFT_665785 [Tothia fuscella]|uniref:Uncharacterized protein n=1 Tax=Tothia fuscella TaxID=1048955 RepID=A0A9P4NGF8_9PEZI|nr:hypothetical protein EJ08DRAFT_665785 [Tothia fuscella]